MNTERRLRSLEEHAEGGYQPVVVVIDRTIGHEDYQEAARRSGTFLDERGRPVIKIVMCGRDGDL